MMDHRTEKVELIHMHVGVLMIETHFDGSKKFIIADNWDNPQHIWCLEPEEHDLARLLFG